MNNETDLDVIRDMLKRLQERNSEVRVNEYILREGGTQIAARGEAGYVNFLAAFQFDAEGQLVDIGGWED